MKSAFFSAFMVILFLSLITSPEGLNAATSVTSMKTTVALPTPVFATPVKPVVTGASKVYATAKAISLPPPGPVPAATCPQTKAQFDTAMTWTMTGARPDVCDYTMWDAGCINVFRSVAACNSGNCTEHCHQADTLVVDIYHCSLPNAYKQLVYSYAGKGQAVIDACMAKLKKLGM